VKSAEPSTKPVKSILISQPKPEGKSPYLDLAEKHGIKVDFRPFIQVDSIDAKEFRKQKISIPEYTAVIFNSRTAIDHFFHLCEEMRVTMSPDTKYYCISEAVALYLQKYIQYRKRKVFFGKGRTAGLMDVLLKHKDRETYLFPCSEPRKPEIPEFLETNKFRFAEAMIYRTVSADLSDLEDIFYDMIVFFSPSGIKSLFDNFPDFQQNETRLAGFGPATKASILEAGLRLDIEAPLPDVPSMTMAIARYIKASNA
jgi:uroporphyrinogen-III synthase